MMEFLTKLGKTAGYVLAVTAVVSAIGTYAWKYHIKEIMVVPTAERLSSDPVFIASVRASLNTTKVDYYRGKGKELETTAKHGADKRFYKDEACKKGRIKTAIITDSRQAAICGCMSEGESGHGWYCWD